MALTIGVRFRENGKVYDFAAGDLRPQVGDMVVVETARGTECATVVTPCRETPENKTAQPLKPVLRAATQADMRRFEEMRAKERHAMEICQKKIAEHKLEMKLVDAEYAADNAKILFYFTADGRVDFRELVKDLASVFRTRIELRQIGVRDEAKMLGGFGICGRPFCCKTFLGDFQPVSIKMAKEQGLSLNPVKISGTCGRLMCCLKYEQDAYEHLLRHTPKVGAFVETREGRGTVIENNLITGILKIRLDRRPDAAPLVVDRHEVKLLKDAKIQVDKSEIEALKGIE